MDVLISVIIVGGPIMGIFCYLIIHDINVFRRMKRYKQRNLPPTEYQKILAELNKEYPGMD